MTTGALIFAFDNQEIDYIRMAGWASSNIKRHLNIPVAVVTDNEIKAKNYDFDRIIVQTAQSGGQRTSAHGPASTWYNAGRIDSYDLSPWHNTLVLDADYVVASKQLEILLDCNQDFIAHQSAYDIVTQNDFVELNHYGNYKMPMSWATVMMFRRSEHTQLIFDCMRMIFKNWKHYTDLCQTNTPVYRNDYALSIALNIVNGHTLNHTAIPWDLASLTPEHTVTQIAQDHYRVDYINNEKRAKWITLQNQDFHAMGKQHLEKIIETH
jgi:hypothetical protein